MSDDVKDLVISTEKDMQKSLEAMDNDFHKYRTGRATTGLVDKLSVEYYGTWTQLRELAQITIPDARTIAISPFDKSSLKAIEKAIQDSPDLKLTPMNDGKVIRLNIPPLTQERRKDLVKLVHKRLEEAKISIRNYRRDAMDMLKELENEDMISEDDHKRGKEEVEKSTQKFVVKADEMGARKEREVMEI
ncbi:MAG: ribosome recycling factor [Anaerolineae bacterium]|nr:ribosome recycling factor [Anaerolineae bacterium]